MFEESILIMCSHTHIYLYINMLWVDVPPQQQKLHHENSLIFFELWLSLRRRCLFRNHGESDQEKKESKQKGKKKAYLQQVEVDWPQPSRCFVAWTWK